MEKAYTPLPRDEEVVQTNSEISNTSAQVFELRPFEASSYSLRTFACFIDQGILFLPQCLFSIAMAGIGFIVLSQTSIEISFIRAICVGSFMASMMIVHWLYFALSESSSKKATFGMSLLGLKLQKEHGEGLNFFEASNRYWAWFFSSLFFGVNLLGFFGKKKKMLHDQINDTEVVIHC